MSPLRLLAAACILAVAPVVARAQREKLPPDDYDYVMNKWPDAKISNTGIRYIVEAKGAGPLLVPGDQAMVLYTGALLNGKVFDRLTDRKHPFTFRVARDAVIIGWDQILQLMRPGDKWLVIVPPELAYGRRGSPPAIPGDATLVFEIEVVGIKKDS
jgi:FKBP-type peptidyl-prolyl cis-trans isomerase